MLHGEWCMGGGNVVMVCVGGGKSCKCEMCLRVLVLPEFIVCYRFAKCIKGNNKGKYSVPLFND